MDGVDVVPEGVVEISIYPHTAIVREQRRVSLTKGVGKVRFDDMPLLLDPGSVRFESLSDPGGTRAIAQRVRQGPRPESEFPRWVVVTGDPNQPVSLRGGTSRVTKHDPVVEGVTWTVESASGGDQEVAVTYQTGGISWRADYAIVLVDAAGETADLNAWITVDNQSGRTFSAAALVLFAREKEPRKLEPPPATPQPAYSGGYGAGYGGSYVPPQSYAPAAPAIPKYRRYAYSRRVTLDDRAQRQLEWFDESLRGVNSRKRIVFDPVGEAYDHDEVEPIMDKDYASGIQGAVSISVELPPAIRAMPPGRARVFQRAEDGRLSLLGAAQLGHVDEGDPVRVQLGAVPGLTGVRRRTDFRADKKTRRVIEAFEIEVKNDNDRTERVIVREHLYRGKRWEITVASHERVAEGKRGVSFELKVPKRGKAKVRYRVVYSWDKEPEKPKRKTDSE